MTAAAAVDKTDVGYVEMMAEMLLELLDYELLEAFEDLNLGHEDYYLEALANAGASLDWFEESLGLVEDCNEKRYGIYNFKLLIERKLQANHS